MESFRDAAGKIWEISLTIGKAKRIKARHKFDILADNAAVVSQKLATDPVLRMDVLYVLLEHTDVEQEEFDDLLCSGAFAEADIAFWKEFENFTTCLDPTRAEAIKRLVAKERAAGKQALEAIVEVAESEEMVKLEAEMLEKAKTNAYKEMMSGTTSIESLEESE